MAATKVVLLACGSFNPVTNMHLRMFELGRDTLQRTGQYKVIAGIVSPVSDAYSKKELVSAKHRCAMIRLALKSSDWIKLDTWESELDHWSPTLQILRHHCNKLETMRNSNLSDDVRSLSSPTKRRRVTRIQNNKNIKVDSCDYTIPLNMNDTGNVQLKLLCGADLLESFSVPGLWKDEDIEEIVNKFGLVCISRAGFSPEKFIYESDVLSKYQNNITIATEWITNEISSTKIRRSIRRKESVKYLLQDSVIDYINKHELYSVNDNKYMNHMTPSPNRDDAPDVSTVPSVQNIQFLSPTSSDSNGGHHGNGNSSPSGYSSGNELDDEDDSLKHSPRKNNPGCLTDLGSIVRRVRRVALTPETCV